MLENEANRIRAGTRLDEAIHDAVAETIQRSVGTDTELGRLIGAVAAANVRGVVNKTYVAAHAAETLSIEDSRPSQSPDTDSAVNDSDLDWLNYLGGYAEKASSKALRELWGRILAGEIRRRGSFSLMTLRLMAEMDQETARMFEEVVEHRIRNEFILPPNETKGAMVVRLAHLEQVGLLHHVAPNSGLMRRFSPDADGYAAIFVENLCLRLRLDGEARLKIVPLTRIGQEVASLLAPVDEMAVLKRVAERLRASAKAMDICKVVSERDGMALLDPIEVLKASP